MRSRKGAQDAVPAGDGELENWLHELVDGEVTARRFRQRLKAAGERPEDPCEVCQGAATGTIYFGLDGHVHRRVSA